MLVGWLENIDLTGPRWVLAYIGMWINQYRAHGEYVHFCEIAPTIHYARQRECEHNGVITREHTRAYTQRNIELSAER